MKPFKFFLVLIIGTAVVEWIKLLCGLEISSDRMSHPSAQVINAIMYMLWGYVFYYYVNKYLIKKLPD